MHCDQLRAAREGLKAFFAGCSPTSAALAARRKTQLEQLHFHGHGQACPSGEQTLPRWSGDDRVQQTLQTLAARRPPRGAGLDT